MRNLTQRVLGGCLALVMVAGLAAGCSKKNQAQKSGPKQIVVWEQGTDQEIAFYNNMFKEIDEKNADFTIKVVNQPKLPDSLNAAINSHDLPDISQVDGTQISTYKFDKILLPLGQYISKATMDDLLPSIKEEITESDGKNYALAQFDSGLSFWEINPC